MAVELNEDEAQAKKWFQASIDYYSHAYVSRCDKCGKPYTLITQENGMAEYHLLVCVECFCGGRAYFELPVN